MHTTAIAKCECAHRTNSPAIKSKSKHRKRGEKSKIITQNSNEHELLASAAQRPHVHTIHSRWPCEKRKLGRNEFMIFKKIDIYCLIYALLLAFGKRASVCVCVCVCVCGCVSEFDGRCVINKISDAFLTTPSNTRLSTVQCWFEQLVFARN